MQNYLIGVDIGTQGTKAALYHEDGTQVSEAFEKSNLISPKPGEVEQDPEELYGSVIRTIKKLIDTTKIPPEKIVAVGMDAQMAGIMGIDEDWQAVTPYDSWLDTKCEPYIHHMKKVAQEEIIRITGGQVTYAHGPKVLWWKNERPEIYKKVAKFIMPTTYVAGRICGLKAKDAYIDYTHLHFTGFADVNHMKWDTGLLQVFGVEPNKMPNICNPFDVIGTVTKVAAELCGLLSGTPVVAGCGDSAASSLGAGIIKDGMIYDVGGTASIFSCSTKEYRPDFKHKTILYARSAVKDLWIPLSYISGGGLCLSWFQKLSGLEYAELEELATKVKPGSEGLSFVPHFAGRTCPNEPNMSGGFIGLNWNHNNGHLYRSIMESIAFEYNYYFTVLKEQNPNLKPHGIYGVGGCAKSVLFNQMKADVLGIPYYKLKSLDAGTFGSAVLAGYGAGLYKSFDITLKVQTKETSIEPNLTDNVSYASHAKRYQIFMKHMGNLYQNLSEYDKINE